MKKQLRSFTWMITTILYIIMCSFFSQAQNIQRLAVPEDVTQWIKTSFGKGKLPPLSFVYEGKHSADFLKKWKYSWLQEVSEEPNVVKYTVSYLDPESGLRLDCHISGFNDVNTVEWVLNFTNTSGNNSSTLEQVKVIDFTVQPKTTGRFTLYHTNGSDAKRSDFQPLSTVLKTGEPLRFQPAGGRSSDASGFPFFNLETPDHTGIVTAIGWSGNWFFELEQNIDKATTLSAGMANMKLFLQPGETIRTPSVCMLFWQSEDRMTGHNQFRRFLLTHKVRKIDGQFAEYPLCGGFNWGDPYPCNEYSCLTEDYACALINRYKQFGITPEVFWLDAGWYTGGGNWYENTGNWTIDSTRFPNGLTPLSDAAHRVGAKFMVWFEPERVHVHSEFANKHPEWMLYEASNKDNYLFDLGNAEARQWLMKYFGDFIEQNGIDYYRQDFNIRPEAFWTANDEPGRTGLKEIRYIEGLYAYWDYLLKRFPNLLIDNCASGGRRLDLETVSRSAPLWRTDYQYGEPNGYQCHTYGLNFFLPLSGTGVNRTDAFSFRSSLGSAVVLNWKLTNADMSIPEMQQCVAAFKELRPYYYEDYYPLTGIGDLTGDDVWLAYQLNKPSDDSGIVLGFRRKDNTVGSLEVQLRGLDANAVYSVYNDNDKSLVERTGKELAEGIVLEIGKAPGSILLKYRKK
ncbi:alpha-galactosidase [Maribellus sp. YY47]|uniref:alpha-galactosidase n=1 Tax=Maribellus sp. YY47 TaxID=2929486 RepID=UPI002000DC13|nr:alpha-galactosidase [Maribellus sp. YY47]MCK3684460.1 alpha-galactosidase [Maribellus sp. YY47]